MHSWIFEDYHSIAPVGHIGEAGTTFKSYCMHTFLVGRPKTCPVNYPSACEHACAVAGGSYDTLTTARNDRTFARMCRFSPDYFRTHKR